jgi:hypothetical protein
VRTGVVGPNTDSTFKGLKGLAANDAAVQATILEIEKALDELNTAANKKDYVLDDLVKDIRIQMQNLDRLRPQSAADAAAAVSDIPDVPSDDVPSEDVPASSEPVPPADQPPMDQPLESPEPPDVGPADETDTEGDVPG